MSIAFGDELVQKVRDGWIPAHIYNDTEIFDAERTRIFGRSWQFLAHASEIPQPGDYVVRRVLDDSFVVARGEDGVIRVLFNMCLHRGMQICRAEMGNASHFRCPYHGWTYKNDGRLVGVPFHAEAYGGDRGLLRDEHQLLPAPAMEIFNGLVFVSLNPDVEPLRDYLGGAADYLSFYTAPTSEGIEVWGPQRWRAGWNWKIAAENFCGDSYHTPHTHASMLEIGLTPQIKGGQRKTGGTYNAGRGFGATFGLGEGDLETKLSGIGYPERAVANRKRYWPESIKSLVADSGHLPSSMTLFPNLSFLHLWVTVDDEGTAVPMTTMRLWQPVSESETEVFSWFAVDADASPEFKDASHRAYLMTFGSSGMFEQDDMENWLSLTRTAKGSMARRLVLNSRMGLLHNNDSLRQPLEGFSGPGTVIQGFSEHNQRGWLNLWLDCMSADEPATATTTRSDV
ncbi:MAG TPA: aromatic ring-hydroxylating dioxygenase subunit alpha [Streptosporangiaceae bacterium]|nr:aromatic ring-hydroxylating dioxygenase subunit alpha [Streptosporangiaceae bacterium]